MKIENAMIKNVCSCSPDTTLEAIAMMMWTNDCGCVPVVDADNKPLGIVTDRDITIGLALQHKSMWEARARDITSSRTLFLCRDIDDIHGALDMMRQHHIRRLPVVDGEGRLTGIISLGDILACAEINTGAELPMADTVPMLRAVSGHHTASALAT